MKSLDEIIASARVKVRKLKKVSPEIFPEYSRLVCAERDFKLAKIELKAAKNAWRKLGAE